MDALRRVRMFLTQRHEGTEQWCVNFLITGRKAPPLASPEGASQTLCELCGSA